MVALLWPSICCTTFHPRRTRARRREHPPRPDRV